MSNLILGTGSYLPQRVVTNAELEAMGVNFDRGRAGGTALDPWVRSRHGAVSRHWADPGECTSDLATAAARRALDSAGFDRRDVDLIVLATLTNDCPLPQAAYLVQVKLGSKAKVIQLDCACTGFVDGLLVACGLLDTGQFETALVVGADTVSRISDPREFMPLTIFGDGAGAVVLQHQRQDDGYGVRSFATGSDGHVGDYVCIPGGGGRQPFSQDVLDRRLHYWRFKFPEIRAWGVERFAFATLEAVKRAGITLADIDWVVPHQASLNLLCAVAERLELDMAKIVVTYPRTGNVSAASIPVALDEARRAERFQDGQWLVMPAVGAGMAWGAATYRWRNGTHAPGPGGRHS
jgi:3-oxoacyl-[acyl-carrier-protein] synthase-3